MAPVSLKQKPGWARGQVWSFWRTEKSFVPTRIQTPDHPDGGIDAILTMLTRPQNFTLEQVMKAQSLFQLYRRLGGPQDQVRVKLSLVYVKVRLS
jgi:hypothetical protein